MASIQRIADANEPSSLVMDSGDSKLLAEKKIVFLESVLEATLRQEHCLELTTTERPLSTTLRTEDYLEMRTIWNYHINRTLLGTMYSREKPTGTAL
jgi:hypothetical protein